MPADAQRAGHGTFTAEIVARARTGQSDALSALYTEFAGDLLRLAARLLGSHQDAEDVVHDLFVGLPERLTRYQEAGSFGPWIRALTVGLARMYRRRDARRDRVMDADTDVYLLAGSTPEPGGAIDIEREVARLPERLRAVFVLKQWEGYSHDEIASLLGITSGSSRVRHLRALRLLRMRLDP
jgi:RNA polymerase sigma-70 factor (ECF subfamily)